MRAKTIVVLLFLAALAAVAWMVRGRLAPSAPAPGQPPGGPTPAADAKPGRPGAPPVEITVLYGTEKRRWLEMAAGEFAKVRPEIKVNLVGKGSLEGAESILEGKDRPTLFSPADELALALLDADWQTKNGAPIVAREGDDAPQPLLITPLVFAIWEDRAAALKKSNGQKITWKVIHKAVTSNRGWPAVGGKPEWGFVKLGHTDPTRSNSGLQALLLMTYEFHGKRSGLKVEDVLDPKYQAFVAGIEKGVPRFEHSTGTFMTELVRFGPSKYDIAVVYENLVVEQIENAQGRWGNLRVYYPEVTLWSDHPIALLKAEWVTPAQREAGRAFAAFLRSRPMQERALAFGFRPGDPSVPIRTPDAANPFTRLAQYGLSVDLPPVATAPDAPVVRNLLTMWSRVVGPR
jgi:hypothetical protein